MAFCTKGTVVYWKIQCWYQNVSITQWWHLCILFKHWLNNLLLIPCVKVLLAVSDHYVWFASSLKWLRSFLPFQCPSLPGALRGTSFAKQWHLVPGMEWPHATVQAGCQLGRSGSAGLPCTALHYTALGMHHSRLKVIISCYLAQIWSAVTSFGFSSARKMMTNWRRAYGGPLTWLGRREHFFSLSLSRLRRYPIAIFSYLTDNWKRWDQTFLRGAQLQQIQVQ